MRKLFQKNKPVKSRDIVGILNSLEPPKKDGALSGNTTGTVGTGSLGTIPTDEKESRYFGSMSDIGHGGQMAVDWEREKEKEKKKGFWNMRDKDKERERERDGQRELEAQLRKEKQEKEYQERERENSRREEDSSGELTQMIGYLTATAAEDWSLLMDVCDRASSSVANAKEAVRALRREFKYGEPPAQLSAARVWAVMLHNCSEVFISQSTTRKFLDTIEDLLSSSRTSPVVRERLLEVVAAAAYASGQKKGSDNQGFKGLWKRVRPFDKAEEGIPFNTTDSMFQPPNSAPIQNFQEQPLDPPAPNKAPKKRKPPSNQIIPLEEDIRRLFQECKIGQGNTAVLADALLRAKPGDLKKVDVIKEFHAKCLASQELICAQIPWATSLAERSRAPENVQQQRDPTPPTATNDSLTNVTVVELMEEKLLAALLAANAELMEVLRQWDDLNRLALEQKVEDTNRRNVRVNSERDHEINPSADTLHVRISSRTPSPHSRSNSPVRRPTTPPPLSSFQSEHDTRRQTPSLYDSDSDPSIRSQSQQTNLAPPPAAPHGPRSPAHLPRSTPSPAPLPQVNGHAHTDPYLGDSDSLSSLEEDIPIQPSAKALGKRKVVDVEIASIQPSDVTEVFRDNRQSYQSTNGLDNAFDNDRGWPHAPVQFVYDAVAERRRQIVLDSTERVHSVH